MIFSLTINFRHKSKISLLILLTFQFAIGVISSESSVSSVSSVVYCIFL